MAMGAAATNDTPVPNESLTSRAYRLLEEMIVTLRLEPGAVLSESRLAEQLRIGRTPIREALQQLSREGLVTIIPRKAVIVTDINPRKQLLLLEVRREVERLMARSGARRRTADERAELFDIAEGLDKAAAEEDGIAFMRIDNRFNGVIARACHNEYASRAVGLIHGLSRRFWFVHFKEAADLPLCARLHADLARAMADGDERRAAAASDALMDYVEAFTRATLDLAPGAERRPME